MCDVYQMEGDCKSAPAMPVSPIESAFSELGLELIELEESVKRLHSRTAKVATPPLPPLPVAAEAMENTGPHSETWHGIRIARQRIAIISADIRELTSRLET